MKKIALTFVIIVLSVCITSVSAFPYNEYETGLKHYNRGEFGEAVKYLKRYVEKNPTSSAYYLIGYSLYKLDRHDEAHEYFKEAYLINTEFSPTPSFDAKTQAELMDERIGEVKPAVPVTAIPVTPETPAKATQEDQKMLRALITPPPVLPEETVIPEPEGPEIIPEEAVSPAEEPAPGTETAPRVTITPPGDFPGDMEVPEMPEMPKGLMAAAGIVGLLSGVFGILLQIGIYVFTALCLFRIGKRLDVPNSWIAWIPVLNYFWPLVGAAGQTVKWGIIYLIVIPLLAGLVASLFAMASPMLAMLVLGIVGLVVLGLYIYLWMNVSENLGKERLLGLLMIIPIVNFIFMGYLAFSEQG
jgi:hypothetical protein